MSTEVQWRIATRSNNRLQNNARSNTGLASAGIARFLGGTSSSAVAASAVQGPLGSLLCSRGAASSSVERVQQGLPLGEGEAPRVYRQPVDEVVGGTGSVA